MAGHVSTGSIHKNGKKRSRAHLKHCVANCREIIKRVMKMTALLDAESCSRTEIRVHTFVGACIYRASLHTSELGRDPASACPWSPGAGDAPGGRSPGAAGSIGVGTGGGMAPVAFLQPRVALCPWGPFPLPLQV